MTQIKLFAEKTPELEKVEKMVNDFLSANEGKILVKDIKYTAEQVNQNNPVWKYWSVMVIYDVIE